MQITVDIPEGLAAQIIAAGKHPCQAVMEALALEGYRSQQLSEFEVKQMLGFETRMQVHSFLKEHGVYLHYSMEDLEQDRETMKRIFGDAPLSIRRME